MNEKHILRERMKEQRKMLSSEQKQIFDKMICEKLHDLIIEKGAKVVHSFIPMSDEINILPIIKNLLHNEVKVVCPKAMKNRVMQNLVLRSIDNLENGVYGTQHPANSNEYTGDYDIILVPGLAFDNQMNRLGYGAGYYDKFLNRQSNAIKIGVCYPFQLLDRIPVEQHDVVLDEIVC